MTLNNNQVKFKLTKIKVYDERNFKKFVTSGFLGSCVHQVLSWLQYGYISMGTPGTLEMDRSAQLFVFPGSPFQ